MLELLGVSKRYPDGTQAVEALDLQVQEGELLCLVGPSGCGKTTTLKMMNRLVEPTSGRLLLQGEDVTSVDVRELRRRTGYVIQQVGLFPHRTVAANVATVPRLLRWQRERVRARVDELLDLVGLEPGVYRDRYPAQLSGGQRQRVGVARALAADPPVLLMDEPFSAVDPVARERLQAEFLALQERLRKTIVVVTHDIDEAVRLGDRIAVFAPGGRLEQIGTPAEVLGAPATPSVASFVGSERGLRRLTVTPLDLDALEHPPVVTPGTGPGVVLDGAGRLQGLADEAGQVRPLPRVAPDVAASTALSALLGDPDGVVAVVEPREERFLGLLTLAGVHRSAASVEAIRRTR